MEIVAVNQVQIVTLADLKTWHSDALCCFDISLASQSHKFKNRTLIDFYFGYFKKPVTKPTRISPTSALDGMGEFLKAINEETRAHEPRAVSEEGEAVGTSEHPENLECVTKKLPGHYILMMEAGMPGFFSIVEEFPMLTDVKTLKAKLDKK